MATKVMLVDDQESFVEPLCKRLQKREFEVTVAFNGAEALEKLVQNSNIDVVVLDVKMPGMDGIDVLKAIKIKYPLIEVIMLTGHATVESAIEGMKQGAIDYLMKPCEIDVLVDKVKEARSKKRKQEQKIAEAHAYNISLRRGD